MIRFLALLAFAGAVLAGCGSSDSQTTVTVTNEAGSAVEITVSKSPGDFYTELIGYEVKGQTGRMWGELHPGQQAVIDRAKFDECAQDLLRGMPADANASVEEVYDEAIQAEGVPETTSKAITMTVESNGAKVSLTRHAILHEGKWTWILKDSEVDAYKAGTCPT